MNVRLETEKNPKDIKPHGSEKIIQKMVKLTFVSFKNSVRVVTSISSSEISNIGVKNARIVESLSISPYR